MHATASRGWSLNGVIQKRSPGKLSGHFRPTHLKLAHIGKAIPPQINRILPDSCGLVHVDAQWLKRAGRTKGTGGRQLVGPAMYFSHGQLGSRSRSLLLSNPLGNGTSHEFSNGSTSLLTHLLQGFPLGFVEVHHSTPFRHAAHSTSPLG